MSRAAAAPHWAAGVARAQLTGAAARTERVAEAAGAHAARCAAVTEHGEAFIAAVVTACTEAIDAYNGALGTAVVRVVPLASGVVLDAPGAQFSILLDVVHDPETLAAIGDPGVKITRRNRGGGDDSPLPFIAEGGTLRVLFGGQRLDAEELVRAALQPWLTALERAERS